MELRIPKKGELYRHFKGNLYEVLTIARDSETLEEMVVYKEADGDTAYVRPLRMFVSKVDRSKYPEAQQEYRFEVVREADTVVNEKEESTLVQNNMIMEFLDLSTAIEKINYLQSVRERITEEFIGIVAQSLEFVENEGSLRERYDAVLRYLRIVSQYESSRIR